MRINFLRKYIDNYEGRRQRSSASVRILSGGAFCIKEVSAYEHGASDKQRGILKGYCFFNSSEYSGEIRPGDFLNNPRGSIRF